MALTDTAIRLARPRERAYKLSDGRGLCLLVQPNGSKWWRYRYEYPTRRGRRLQFIGVEFLACFALALGGGFLLSPSPVAQVALNLSGVALTAGIAMGIFLALLGRSFYKVPSDETDRT